MVNLARTQNAKKLLERLKPNERGQSLVIIVFAFLGLIAMLGLALDLGLVYVEQTRVKRAIDAAVLAGVVELPHEEQAILQAINYLDQNGYQLWNPLDPTEAQVVITVNGCAHENYLDPSSPYLNYDNQQYFPPAGTAIASDAIEFVIDTKSYQAKDGNGNPLPDQCDPSAELFGTAQKISINGLVPVNMNFMQFFGFGEVDVGDNAIAQNVTSLDVVIVFDVSGSMQFDTVGYGFYEPYGDGTIPWQTQHLNDPNYSPNYPNPAYYNPIPTDHLPATSAGASAVPGIGLNIGQLCWGRDGNISQPRLIATGGSLIEYLVLEAELYTKNYSTYDRTFRTPGKSYWAVQHTNNRTVYKMLGEDGDPDTSYEVGASPIITGYTRSSWVSHHPFVTWAVEPSGDIEGKPFGKDYTITDAELSVEHSLDYHFITSGTWDATGQSSYIWVRMQAGGSNFGTGNRSIFWNIYQDGSPTPLLTDIQTVTAAEESGNFKYANYGGADAVGWRWYRLNAAGLPLQSSTRYILKIWAGGVGHDIDQFIIANSNNENGILPPNNGFRQATPGSAFGQACNRCNPIYGQTIGLQSDCEFPVDNGASLVTQDNVNLLEDDLFAGYQPVREAKEATKRFLAELKPNFDQAGFVAYNHTTTDDGKVELQCLRRAQVNPSINCSDGTNALTYTQIIDVVERVPAFGSTNIAQGMRDGLEILGHNVDGLASFDTSCDGSVGSHCGRGSAAKQVLVVITDGVGNTNPWDEEDVPGVPNSPVNCRSVDLFTPNLQPDTGGNRSINRARDCTIHYTNQAVNNNVTVFTIGLGNGVDTELLELVGDIGKGGYFNAATPAQLDEIFELILQNVSVRLIQ